MKIHEYQARQLLADYGLPVPPGEVVRDPAAAVAAAGRLGLPVVIKAQVLVGGRGKAGGVKVAGSEEEVMRYAADILALTIKGIKVERLLVAQAVAIQKEYYLGLAVDRTGKRIVAIASASGGVEIEELAAREPEKIVQLPIEPLTGPQDKELRGPLAEVFPGAREEQAWLALTALYRLLREKDCSLVEINPYAELPGERLVAADAKINFDDNGVFKHPEVEKLRNPEEYAPGEMEARQAGLSFVSLDGEIGCIVNGAGLAMATMDQIKLFGGTPANFLDVGGSSSPEKVLKALEIITANPRVKAILINIFGGITRCDDIARGIVIARDRISLTVPLVIRLIGTNEREGRAILKEAGLAAAERMTDAVRRVIQEAGGAA